MKTDKNKKHEVQLHSSDMLIFGSPSRLIGHNIAVIVHDSLLLTNLRDLWLNLTYCKHMQRRKGKKSEKSEKSKKSEKSEKSKKSEKSEKSEQVPKYT